MSDIERWAKRLRRGTCCFGIAGDEAYFPKSTPSQLWQDSGTLSSKLIIQSPDMDFFGGMSPGFLAFGSRYIHGLS